MATKDPRTPNSTRPGYAAPCLCVLWPPKPKPPNPPLGPLPPFHRQLLGIPHVAARSSCPPLLARVSYGTQNQCDGAGGIGWRRGSGVVFAWRRRRTGCLRSKRVYRTRTRTGTADLLGLTAVAEDLAMIQHRSQSGRGPLSQRAREMQTSPTIRVQTLRPLWTAGRLVTYRGQIDDPTPRSGSINISGNPEKRINPMARFRGCQQ